MSKITLVWHTKATNGWRYFQPLYEYAHNKIQPRHGWVRENGKEVEYKEGRYFIRSHETGKRVYVLCPSQHPRDAYTFLEKTRQKLVGTNNSRNSVNVLKTAVKAYIRDCEHRQVLIQAKKSQATLDEFTKLLPSSVALTRSITRQHVLDYHTKLRTRGLSERTIANNHKRLVGFFKFCKVDLSFLPPTPKFEKKLPTIYSSEQIKALRAACAGDEYTTLLIEMALQLGLRERELMFASWSDVDFAESVFRVTGKPKLGFTIKTQQQRDIPISASLLSLLQTWKKKREHTTLILSKRGDKPEAHLLRKLKILARDAGLNCGHCDGCKSKLRHCRAFTLHHWRRTYITTLLRRGFDLATIQAWAGHADISSTTRYLRPDHALQSRLSSVDWTA